MATSSKEINIEINKQMQGHIKIRVDLQAELDECKGNVYSYFNESIDFKDVNIALEQFQRRVHNLRDESVELNERRSSTYKFENTRARNLINFLIDWNRGLFLDMIKVHNILSLEILKRSRKQLKRSRIHVKNTIKHMFDKYEESRKILSSQFQEFQKDLNIFLGLSDYEDKIIECINKLLTLFDRFNNNEHQKEMGKLEAQLTDLDQNYAWKDEFRYAYEILGQNKKLCARIEQQIRFIENADEIVLYDSNEDMTNILKQISEIKTEYEAFKIKFLHAQLQSIIARRVGV